MPSLRNFRYARFNSAIARAALSTYFRSGRSYRLLMGPLRGSRMRYDRSVNFHAILGLWDADILDLLDEIFVKGGLLPKGSVVADVGANIGYYSMWFSKVALENGQIYSFEPNAEIVPLLSENLALNGIDNVEIVDSACSDRVGQTEFFIAAHHHSSSLHGAWAGEDQGTARKITVPVTTLDAFFAPATGRPMPKFIKFDIEGGATHALPGCQRVLAESRPYVLIESHTVKEDQAISRVLTNFNYRAYRLNDRKWVENPEAVHPDKRGVWGTLLLIPEEHCADVSGRLGHA